MTKYIYNIALFSSILFFQFSAFATEYHVGPKQSLKSISEVPWATLQAGDHVFIHWRSTPYKEKWIINRQGTKNNPIIISGVIGPNGELPIIDGRDAVTAKGLNFWNESRGVVKIGGSNTPTDGMPQYIIVENLDIRSGRPPYSFKNDKGQNEKYANNAAAIYIEKGQFITIRNCKLHDCGNGLFSGAFNGESTDLLIEKNHIYDNGIEGRFYEHNTYTAGINVTYQYNHFGPLREDCRGNNLKDRSAGLVVRYNWIESGNRQLDLVDAEDSKVLVNHPKYHQTHVYGNILIEPEGAGNSQMIHYGGDSDTEDDYRKGELLLYNNTIISTRSGFVTLLRLSTSSESAQMFNNVIYTSSKGNNFAMLGKNGTLNMHHNWLKTGWKNSHSTFNGKINDQGNNLSGSIPMFVDFNNQDFHLLKQSPLIDQADMLPVSWIDFPINNQYVKHLQFENRLTFGDLDIGAFERAWSTSEDHLYWDGIIISPNPSNGIFYFNIKQGLEYFEVLELNGSLIQLNSKTKSFVDLSHLPKGMYFLKLYFENQIIIKRIIKN